MNRLINNIISIGLLTVLLLSACKKDEDDQRPTIRIDDPTQSAVFFSRDTIPVSGYAADDKQLEYVRIVIRDEQNNNVSPPKVFYPGSGTFVIDFNYIIDEASLPSGNYMLVGTASDGTNTSSQYVSITLKGIERELEKLLVLCQPNTLKTFLYSISNDGSVHTEMNLDFGYVSSAINHGQRSLYMLKPQPSVLISYDLDELLGDEVITAIPPYPVYNHVYAEPDITYLASGNGDILGVNHYEQIIYNTDVDTDVEPLLIYPHYNYMLSFCRKRAGTDLVLRQHYITTGVFRLDKEINFSIVDFKSLDSDRCLLFANKDGASMVYEYGPAENYIYVLKDLPDGSIHAVADVSGGDFVIAHDLGLYYYRTSDNTLMEWIPGLNAEHMAYDEINQLLYASKDDTVYIIRKADGTILSEVNMPYKVLNMHIQYTI